MWPCLPARFRILVVLFGDEFYSVKSPFSFILFIKIFLCPKKKKKLKNGLVTVRVELESAWSIAESLTSRGNKSLWYRSIIRTKQFV